MPRAASDRRPLAHLMQRLCRSQSTTYRWKAAPRGSTPAHVRRPHLQANVLQRTAVGDVAGGRVPRTDDHRGRPSWRPTWFDEPIAAPDLTLCLLVFALTFPGRNRFRDDPLTAAVDIMLVVGEAAGDPGAVRLRHAQPRLLRRPRAALLGAWRRRCCNGWPCGIGQRDPMRRQAARPEARRTRGGGRRRAAGGQGGAGAERERSDQGIDFVGYFDDRTDERVHGDAVAAAPGRPQGRRRTTSAQHGIREVYITLPLGSQPRIVELLEQVQGTTASIFFVPDVFGISIIQGRLQDMNGVPVVGICETPFTGTNELVKRVSDIVLASHHPGADLAAAAGHRDRRQAQLARAGDLPAAPLRPRRRGDHRLQVPLDDARRTTAPVVRAGHQGRPAHHAASAPSCAAPRSTSCRSSSTCCRAA